MPEGSPGTGWDLRRLFSPGAQAHEGRGDPRTEPHVPVHAAPGNPSPITLEDMSDSRGVCGFRLQTGGDADPPFGARQYPLFRPSGSPRNSSNFPFFPRWRSEFPFSLSRYLGPKGRRPIVRTPEIFIGDAGNVSADDWFFFCLNGPHLFQPAPFSSFLIPISGDSRRLQY